MPAEQTTPAPRRQHPAPACRPHANVVADALDTAPRGKRRLARDTAPLKTPLVSGLPIIVLSLPPSVRVFVATQPVDGRKGADSLMVIVRDVFRHDPLGGHLFVFFSKRCDRVRIGYWDRNGFAMWTKRRQPLSVWPKSCQNKVK